MTATIGTARRFERASPQEAWRSLGASEPVVLGRTGMAWGLGFQHLAAAGEPKKTEGDGRTPAGIYRIGASFGFAASPRPGYRQITDDTVCVDDPASPAYNTITSRSIVGRKVHGENMRAVQRYRRGLLVDYPTDAKARGGSCIFIHIKRSTEAPTASLCRRRALWPGRNSASPAPCSRWRRSRRLPASPTACRGSPMRRESQLIVCSP
jgi:L,D-peptidoglycan transpeptidase YkuD (ErfK/YbiS/YcfS/YnhG family)